MTQFIVRVGGGGGGGSGGSTVEDCGSGNLGSTAAGFFAGGAGGNVYTGGYTASSASSALTPDSFFPDMVRDSIYYYTPLRESKRVNPKKLKKESRKPFKAECRAQQMLRDIIGVDEWRVYRRTMSLAVVGTYTWLFGNITGGWERRNPYGGHVGVYRVDGASPEGKCLLTSFCIAPRGWEQMPFTDRVMTLAMFCANDEVAFKNEANRTGEYKFNKPPVCAEWPEG